MRSPRRDNVGWIRKTRPQFTYVQRRVGSTTDSAAAQARNPHGDRPFNGDGSALRSLSTRVSAWVRNWLPRAAVVRWLLTTRSPHTRCCKAAIRVRAGNLMLAEIGRVQRPGFAEELTLAIAHISEQRRFNPKRPDIKRHAPRHGARISDGMSFRLIRDDFQFR